MTRKDRPKCLTTSQGTGLHHGDPAVREGCCRLLDHLVDTDSVSQLIAMADDPDAHVRIAVFHALACDRCKGDTCAPGADRVLGPALRHLRVIHADSLLQYSKKKRFLGAIE